MTPRKIYISGKITGLDIAYAEKKFEMAEQAMLKAGMHPVNPMKLAHNHDRKWEDYMKEDIGELLTCDGILMLPDWGNSKGARIEYAIAKEMRLWVLYMSDFPPQSKTADQQVSELVQRLKNRA